MLSILLCNIVLEVENKRTLISRKKTLHACRCYGHVENLNETTEIILKPISHQSCRVEDQHKNIKLFFYILK